MTNEEKREKCDEWYVNLMLRDKIFIYEDYNDEKIDSNE